MTKDQHTWKSYIKIGYTEEEGFKMTMEDMSPVKAAGVMDMATHIVMKHELQDSNVRKEEG